MKRPTLLRSIIATVLLFLAPQLAIATTRTVTNLNDSGAGSLRDAINASANGDTIDFDPSVTGTISLTNGRLQVAHNISIFGPGDTLLTVQRDSSTSFPCEIFELINNPTVIISGLTIANGRQTGSTSGTNQGGGIYTTGATLTVEFCTLRDNSASTAGGAIYVGGGSLTLTNCTFSGNSISAPSGQGGAVYVFGNPLTITNCTFSGNSGSVQGGAIYNYNGSTNNSVTIKGSTFDYNSSEEGGAFYTLGGTITIQSSTFVSNSASLHGGGIYNDGQLTVQCCTFSESAIYNIGAGNSLTIGNTILQSSSSSNLVTSGTSITSQGYNLDSGADVYLTAATDLTITDPKLDGVGAQNNGGPTKTIALTPGSPAIDKGNSFGLTSDQRGATRPFDNPNITNANGGDGSDIGAYEAPVNPVQSGPHYVVNTLADHDDGVCGDDCSLRDAILRANVVTGFAKTITFAVTGTITITTTPYEFGINTSNGMMTISGPGARSLAISGNSTHRIFNVNAGNSPVTVSGLTIRDGNYAPSQNQGETRQGGAVLNSGDLTFTDCAFVNNNVAGATNINNGGNGGSGQGGAIFNGAGLTLNRCTFSGCTASGAAGTNNANQVGTGGAGGVGQGAAVWNFATLSISNCTFNANTATGGAGGSGQFGGAGGNANGGVVFNFGGMTVTSATISGNTGTGGFGGNTTVNRGARGSGNGGVSAASGSSNTVRNTIVAGNTGNTAPDAEGAFTSSGYNLIGIGDQSSGFTMIGDLVGTTAASIDPKLGLLKNYGGPTDTMAPLGNSPAIDQGNNFGLTIDQRSHSRPFDEASIPNASDGSDIGAVETDTQVGPTFIVTTATDHDDGICSLADCTLREAINAANAGSGPNTITFAPTVTGSITLSLGTLNVTDSTTIIGPGARVLSVNGNAIYRIFYFSTGTSTISGLTISNGGVVGPAAGPVTGAAAIFNQATLTVNDCTFSANQARGSDGPGGLDGGTVEGGAISNSGTLTLNRCTLSDNSATGGRGGDNFMTFGHAGRGGAGEGAAVFNYTSSTLSINNCTFSGNGATGGAGGNGYFGGGGGNGSAAVFNLGTLTVTAATVGGNTGGGGAGGSSTSGPPGPPGSGMGGLAAGGGSSAVGDTISAGNTGNNGGGKDVNGTFSSNGYNLIGSGDHSTGFTNGTNHDQVGTDAALINPQLGTLQNNGGPTNTMAVLSNSPAINSGDPNAPSQDQRYYLRSGAPDIGAFEFQGALAPVSAGSRKSHGTAGTFDVNLPITSPVGIECRSGGATNDHQLILTFPTPVTINGAPQAQVTNGTGQVGSAGSSNGGVASVTGSVVTVPLTNVSNAQQIAVTLSSVSDGTNTNNVIIPMSVLLGDTTANGTVNSSDIAQTQSQSGQPVNSSNFREDVTANGSINSSDIALVQSKSGTALPVGVSQSPDATTTAPKHRGSPEKSF